MRHCLSFLAFIALLGGLYGYETYKGYKVYDVVPNKVQHEELSMLQYEEGIDFWRLYTPGRMSRVMISPEKIAYFEEFLKAHEIPYEVAIEDMEGPIEEERRSMRKSRQKRATSVPRVTPDFSVFWSAAEIETYCTFLATTYPQFVTLETMTWSPEGRRIYAMKVSSGPVFGQKPIIGMESGMHAREWASPPTVLYLLNRLIENPSTRTELLARVDWLIVPMQNPDGYEFSRNSNRLWRLNRRNVTATCVGVDLNRNNRYSWRQATLTQPCGSQTYPGPSPLSEPESFHLDHLMSRYAHNMKLYLSVHTFGDMVLWPWGYSGSPGWIETHAEHQTLGNLWRNAILANGGRSYQVGNVADVLGNAFGAVDDHMAGTYGVPYVYTLELTSGFQFQYPEERIEALAFETFHGYRAMALYIGETYG
ncbi:carboxypeptidase B-like [Chironomus tepperi]|uniref:carboxypeptidase B-like n=1 Tax=Chironomus tepperi TaxID=113505 RepID=UPI00391F97A5